ncbi:hypothetical protein FOA52_012890 [Chlamydomonas sp. UWO 241]|nr:hypothetical protein FOA52_012890 [Chlamydomonas sp. UWO 241]
MLGVGMLLAVLGAVYCAVLLGPGANHGASLMPLGRIGASASLALTLAFLVRQRQKRKQQRTAQLAGLTKLDLLPFERGRIICMSPPISTVTFFTGDKAAAQRHFAKRVAEIVAANPWLASVLDRDPGSGTMAAYYPPPGAEADGAARSCFEVRDDIALSRGSCATQYAAMAAALAPALCKTSGQSVGKGTPLWRVCVVPDSQDPGGRFALVVSANHSLLDGYSFYSVHNMLSTKAEVRALSPVRKQELTARMVEAMRGGPSLMEGNPAGFIIRLMGGLIWSALFPATCAFGFHVSDEWVGAQKAALVAAKLEDPDGSGVAFVSTNDALMSAFSVCLRCDLAVMAINLRSRVLGCEEGDAGNYQDVISYRPADYASPELVRRSVLGGGRPFVRAADPRTRMLTSWEHVRGATYGVVTNWATFAGAVAVQGAEEVLHVPLFDFPTTTPAKVLAVMVIFRPGAGKGVGVMVAGTQQLIDAVKASGMVGQPLGIEM